MIIIIYNILTHITYIVYCIYISTYNFIATNQIVIIKMNKKNVDVKYKYVYLYIYIYKILYS